VTSDWFDNDDLFLAHLREGHRQAEFVAERLRADGISVRRCMPCTAWPEACMGEDIKRTAV
jgi:hypothetical protein